MILVYDTTAYKIRNMITALNNINSNGAYT